ncbi:hypothetical protein H0H81_003137 [Sphagnurus paluster]|uniref:F-box domain-containing protein n=1 Tax=Sphagnurus paluster TaxID=117069 RepID=A0A9P7FV29_9AGAR|nr:hypothetical protein H0H81_003137 [Sphagnurus paluster]
MASTDISMSPVATTPEKTPTIDTAAIERDRNVGEAIICSLPPELLGQIFVTVQQDFRETQKSPDCGKPAEIALSQVCCYWRCVSYGTSILWAHIYVSSRHPISLASLEVYLQNSHRRPLTITFDRSDKYKSGLFLSWAWPKLVEHISRWYSVSILAHSIPILHQTLIALRQLSAPILHDLSILCEDELDQIGNRHLLLSKGVPRLKRFHLDGFPGSRFVFPRTHLETFTMKTSHTVWDFEKDFRPLIQTFKSLVHLSIQGFKSGELLPPDERLLMDSLRTLRVVYNHNVRANKHDQFWKLIDAPLLETLQLVGAQERDIERTSTLFEQLEHHNIYPALQMLVLDHCDLENGSGETLTVLFPSVKNLACVPSDAANIDALGSIVDGCTGVTSVYVAGDPLNLNIGAEATRLALETAQFNHDPVSVFFMNLESSDKSREANFMDFPLSFSGWEKVKALPTLNGLPSPTDPTTISLRT